MIWRVFRKGCLELFWLLAVLPLIRLIQFASPDTCPRISDQQDRVASAFLAQMQPNRPGGFTESSLNIEFKSFAAIYEGGAMRNEISDWKCRVELIPNDAGHSFVRLLFRVPEPNDRVQEIPAMHHGTPKAQ